MYKFDNGFNFQMILRALFLLFTFMSNPFHVNSGGGFNLGWGGLNYSVHNTKTHNEKENK